jgi:hypothetical protein
MFTQGIHAESSSAQSFHPEFGYLCPTPGMWRKFRSALITAVAGMAIVAGAALALSPQLAPQSEAARMVSKPQIEPQSAAALSVPVPPPAGPVGLTQETVPARLVPTVPPTREHAAGSAPVSCDDLSDSFLAPRCQQGKAGKSRMAHLARTARARAVSTGGADAGPQATAAAPVPAVAANDAVAQPAERSLPAKKPVKTTHKQMPGREVAAAEAAPPAPAREFGLFSLFHAPTRTGGGAWAMSR